MISTLRFHALRKSSRSAGFSLAEILVALALLALLAAVLMPTVAGQLLKGDASRVNQDLNAVRSGVEQFLADVHRYPGKYSDLSKLITTTTTANVDILGNGYNSSMVTKWKGPYVSKDTLSSAIETGFGGSIRNTFMRVTNTNAVEYLTVVVTGISAADFDKVDEQVDGASTSPAGRTSGLLRFVSAGGVDSTKFLAMPIQ
jgi:prepilin-type N-terminal cleavage/methylation domain-containing protein